MTSPLLLPNLTLQVKPHEQLFAPRPQRTSPSLVNTNGAKDRASFHKTLSEATSRSEAKSEKNIVQPRERSETSSKTSIADRRDSRRTTEKQHDNAIDRTANTDKPKLDSSHTPTEFDSHDQCVRDVCDTDPMPQHKESEPQASAQQEPASAQEQQNLVAHDEAGAHAAATVIQTIGAYDSLNADDVTAAECDTQQTDEHADAVPLVFIPATDVIDPALTSNAHDQAPVIVQEAGVTIDAAFLSNDVSASSLPESEITAQQQFSQASSTWQSFTVATTSFTPESLLSVGSNGQLIAPNLDPHMLEFAPVDATHEADLSPPTFIPRTQTNTDATDTVESQIQQRNSANADARTRSPHANPVATTLSTPALAEPAVRIDRSNHTPQSKRAANQHTQAHAVQFATSSEEIAPPAVARSNEVSAQARLMNLTGSAATSANNSSAASISSQGNSVRTASAATASSSQASSGAALQSFLKLDGSTANLSGAAEAPETPANAQHSADSAAARQVVRGLLTMTNQRGGVMTMRLDPPELGQLRIQMHLAAGVVNVEMSANEPSARSLLERNMATLRSALEGQGLTVERMTVHAFAGGAASGGADGESSVGQQRSHADAGSGESRGRRDSESGGAGNGHGESGRNADRSTREAFRIVPEADGDVPIAPRVGERKRP